jgi:hypothetical protein
MVCLCFSLNNTLDARFARASMVISSHQLAQEKQLEATGGEMM